ncbi:response regulator [Caulobacter sp. 73W]|uniref:Response regulator n=1 Tax=Caulobacter sp. 73W TaxID=3161137 RepID=A0AB39KPP3_9CAUL
MSLASALQSATRIQLDQASVLVLDDNGQSLDILCQVVYGFGVRNVHRAETVEQAKEHVASQTLDLILSDVQMPEPDGYDFVHWLRREAKEPNRFAPAILITGHTRQSQVLKARDSGATFTVAKPLTPKVLLERIIWIAREDRMFIECDSYMGPDRRFKFEGPPAGTEGRRHDDLPPEVSSVMGENLSQDEINGFMKPAKVSI